LQTSLSRFIVILGLALFSSCSYSDVELVEVRDVRVVKIDAQGITIKGRLKIDNPNSYPIKVASTEADMYIDGTKTGRANLVNQINVPGRFNDYVDAEVRTDFDKGSLSLLPVMINVGMKGKTKIRLEGNLKARSFVISRKFPFDYTHEAKF
jgi:LEA14-like dessication related protein